MMPNACPGAGGSHPRPWHEPLSGIRARLLSLTLLLWLFVPPGQADALSRLPAAWATGLQSVGPTPLEQNHRQPVEAVARQREIVADLLGDADTPPARLAEAYGRLGALYHNLHVDSAARACYHNALQLAPDSVRWHYYAGLLASQSGLASEALGHFDRVADIQPDYVSLPLQRGTLLLELNRLEEAGQALQKAAALPGQRALALYHLAQIDLLRKQPQAAVERLNEVLRLDPAASQARRPLAQALRLLGDNDGARAQLAASGRQLPVSEDPLMDALRRLNKGPGQHFSRALQAVNKGDYARAAGDFARGLAIQPDNVEARISHARSLYLSDQQSAALAQLDRVLQQQPRQPLALFLSAVMREDQGQPQAAIERHRRLLDDQPGHDGSHYCLANLYAASGQFPQAAHHYQAALQANANIDNARLLYILARATAADSDQTSLTRLDRAIAAQPRDSSLQAARIRLLLLSTDPAVRDVEQARLAVNQLVQHHNTPQHIALQARVAATLGYFDQAAQLQRQLLAVAIWMPQAARTEVAEALNAYEAQRLPAAVWYQSPLQFPPAHNDARLIIREYHTARPY
jgi:tetratricopeptide (TPR) repeat protein